MIKNRNNYNAYMNTYMKNRYKLRRENAIARLGGKCVKCGAECNLHFDHIDPTQKMASISKMSSMSDVKFNAEIDKCQLLCDTCHKAKTLVDGSNDKKNRIVVCDCGKQFKTTNQYAGHKTWCKI